MQGSQNTESHHDYLYRIRHSTAHIMAHAVQLMFSEENVKLAIGPSIENEFYYDMELPRPITPDDFSEIEKQMKRLIKDNEPFEQENWTFDQAREWFTERQQKFKLELIDGLSDHDAESTDEGGAEDGVSIYRSGEFTDLCQGPHVERTRECRYFKLLRVSGAYWRADQSREQLQRIYGTAWSSKGELQTYLTMLKEAEKRDHRRLGKELELFQTHPESPGSIFWLPKGTTVYNILSDKARKLYLSEGYNEVRTPLIYDKSLWETSGHWEHFRQDMFTFPDESGQPASGLKPMNCPAHMLIFKSKRRSYRELPYRLHDQGVLHRNEITGALSGLTRVRQFCQDDSHNFITPEQIEEEHNCILDLISRIYETFNLPYRSVLSTRNPEHFMGAIDVWNEAESALESVLKNNNLDFEINPADAAFYGPKLDFYVRDSLNREHQCATDQLDYQLPERFDLTYTSASGIPERPVVIHRALYGSFERFMGLLIEHYAGAFPVWLAPIQCTVMTISERFVGYAEEVYQLLKSQEVRAELNDQDDKIGAKIRQARLGRVPYMLIIGEREQASRTVAVRSREEGDLGSMDLSAAVEKLVAESNLDF